MALYINGIENDNSTSPIVNGVAITKIIANGITVWSKITITSPKVYGSSTTLTAGVDFPANMSVNICMIGGGGTGNYGNAMVNGGQGYGGRSGTIVSTVGTYSHGETVDVVIGGASSTTKFGSLAAAGGATGGYTGNGGSRSTCYGTSRDGARHQFLNAYGFGGQAGFGNGGNGLTGNGRAGNGGRGAGGGGKGWSFNGGPGSGGAGYVKISW